MVVTESLVRLVRRREGIAVAARIAAVRGGMAMLRGFFWSKLRVEVCFAGMIIGDEVDGEVVCLQYSTGDSIFALVWGAVSHLQCGLGGYRYMRWRRVCALHAGDGELSHSVGSLQGGRELCKADGSGSLLGTEELLVVFLFEKEGVYPSIEIC